MKRISFIILLLFSLQTFSQNTLRVGAECTEDYVPNLKNKNIAIVANQTSYINSVHIVDSLLSLDINVKRIFAPEHGFRGVADAGEHVENGLDVKTNLPIVSLYGSHKKPTKQDLDSIDIVIFDIQDVGVRFYTYISTMHYVMEACAENNVQFLVLDRPNPNGFYIAGPIMEDEFKSFVGMHPVPIVHGMTIAEYAQMINNEGWLKDSIKCDLLIVPCDGYTHSYKYKVPIAPSPNLASMQAIYLYPSLCWFEGTPFSCGRGTKTPFEHIGCPDYKDTSYSFIPKSIEGASKYPRYENKVCYGIDLKEYNTDSIYNINLSILEKAYKGYTGKDEFFQPFFRKLAGTKTIENYLKNELNLTELNSKWNEDLLKFNKMRKKYLIYKDF